MTVNLSVLITQLSDAIMGEKGSELAYLLRPTSPYAKDLVKEFRNPTADTLRDYKGSIASPWDEIAIQYVLVCTDVAKKRPVQAFKNQSSLFQLFLKYFPTSTGWSLPALFSILRDLRDLALEADTHAKYNNQTIQCLEETARIIIPAFTNCINDRTSPPQESRKWGVYYVVGLIFKSYFRVKRISLSKNILRALEANSDLPPLSAYPKSHQVTYRYYLGMISFLNEGYEKAEEELTLAFYHCDIKAHTNQERILTYLLPLRILKGHLPADELLQRFPVLMELFTPFISAIRAGDIASFDSALEKWEHRLLELNLWLTIERARELCIRGLFRRVWVAADKGSRISISMFHASLRISGVDVPQEEAECYVANMIYKGLMRGYISHEKQMVVLANDNAFPRVADRPSPFS
ncbi:COP9 signalosome (CSN) subunit [Pleurotus pulmonarius]|nr:COP9 signalosome (CSN) subunit [Pleurotus pulmonarius]